MKRLNGLWPAMLCIAAFSFAATLWVSASLGTADAARGFSGLPSRPLEVYSRHEAGMPEITDEAVKVWERMDGVKCALPVSEAYVSAEGHGFSVELAALAAPQDKLARARVALSLGKLPESVWQTEVLLGSEAAAKLKAAAEEAGFGMPGHFKLTISGQDPSAQDPPAALDVYVSGVLAPTGAASDECVWVDPPALRQLTGKDGAPTAFDRAYICADDPLRMDAVAGKLIAQGFLTANPAEEPARTLREGKIMERQWGILAALALAAALFASWRSPRSGIPLRALTSAAACTAGMLLAILLTQAAMLLGWRFIVSGEARYILDLPRSVSLFCICIVIGMFGSALTRPAAPPARAA